MSSQKYSYADRFDLKILNNILLILKKIGITTPSFHSIKKSIPKNLNQNSDEINEVLNKYELFLEKGDFTALGEFIHKTIILNSIKKGKKLNVNTNNEYDNINEPHIFVTGLPRSGTTYLHNFLINNLEYQGLKFWEIISPNSLNIPHMFNKSIKKIEAFIAWLLFLYFIPRVQKMHKVKISSYEECWHFLRNYFWCYNYFIQTGFKPFGDLMLNLDISMFYKRYRSYLQSKMLNNPRPFILKNPEHMLYLDNIKDIFPNSISICIHRDPLKTIPSYCGMISQVRYLYFGKINKTEIGEFVMDLYLNMINKMNQTKDNKNVIHIPFNQLINEPLEILTYLNNNFNLKINKIQENKDIKKHSKLYKNELKFSLEDFNLNENDIKNKFSSYYKMYKIN